MASETEQLIIINDASGSETAPQTSLIRRESSRGKLELDAISESVSGSALDIDTQSHDQRRKSFVKKASLEPDGGGLTRRLSAKKSLSAIGSKTLLRRSQSKLSVSRPDLLKEHDSQESFANPSKTIEELRRDEGVRDMVSVTRVLSASSQRRRPKSAAKGSGQVDLYILSDELEDITKTVNQLKTEMAHTCIKALLKPHVYMINISWAPRNLYRHRPDTSFGNPFSAEDISFVDAVLYVTKDLRTLVRRSKVFLPTLATCIGTVKKKLLVLELKPDSPEEKSPSKR